jgi:hypothetical protein
MTSQRLLDLSGGLRLVPVVICLSGLRGVRPLAPDHPDLLPLAGLVELAVLRALAGAAASRAPLDGGYALIDAGGVLIGPECCGTLGDLASWRGAAACRERDWQELWIGHPCMLARYADALLWLSPGHEPDALPREPGPDATICRLAPAALADALAAAERELEGFALRLAAALGDAGAARALAGLPDPPA